MRSSSLTPNSTILHLSSCDFALAGLQTGSCLVFCSGRLLPAPTLSGWRAPFSNHRRAHAFSRKSQLGCPSWHRHRENPIAEYVAARVIPSPPSESAMADSESAFLAVAYDILGLRRRLRHRVCHSEWS